jgi:hypothetical protein
LVTQSKATKSNAYDAYQELCRNKDLIKTSTGFSVETAMPRIQARISQLDSSYDRLYRDTVVDFSSEDLDARIARENLEEGRENAATQFMIGPPASVMRLVGVYILHKFELRGVSVKAEEKTVAVIDFGTTYY